MATEYTRQVLHHVQPPPPVQARFFYTSPIPIDDPLSPLPPPASSSSATYKKAPKPFSEYDNTALDEAWHALRRKIWKYHEEHGEKHEHGSRESSRRPSTANREGKLPSISRPGSLPSSRVGTPRAKPVRPAGSSLGQKDKPLDLVDSLQALDGPSLPPNGAPAIPDTTGTPFLRAPSRKSTAHPLQKTLEASERPKPPLHRDTYEWEDRSHLAEASPAPSQRQKKPETPKTQVAVGVSRLHQVEMPNLQMTPIYWTPVNDTAVVIRGTWFYEETMLPVETSVANMLEAGYTELQVWTDTWKDELQSAIDVGALGEEKITHKLWPGRPKQPPEGGSVLDAGETLLQQVVSANLAGAQPKTPEQLRAEDLEAACDVIDIVSGPGGADNKAAGESQWGYQGSVRTYAQCGVIFANERQARILKPSLMPSDYYGRRPLANYVRKDRKLGIPVVRGFDQAVWDRLHPPKASKQKQRADEGVSTSASGRAPQQRQQSDPDLAKARSPKVTDLVLVIHGIGQKLSQRMESYHFTHAINAFRRDVNVELGTKEVRHRLREDMGGIMMLPVNWRHSLSFEEGGYSDVADSHDDPSINKFGLPDITPDTLPSVRNIVSDVMLDIPYYMSHHQSKMIGAVIKEANRVYKLWCVNNPGFHQYGKVHIIAHSLGSVMAIDILSRQPTKLPQHLLDPTAIDLDTENLEHLLFDTADLFLCGSPAGFFLLLRKSQLLPRLDRASAAAEADVTANTPLVCGERGQFGCIAVENVYNIINGYDPVAYRMNATVDAAYSSSLKQAWIPTATSSWLGNMLFSNAAGGAAADNRHPAMRRLASTVELETHDFTREEIAEKRMSLLNDNGQIDFFIKYGGGPLEIQYLTMLGAHSSYWLLKDFVRMIVIEVGRQRGREGTLPGMRAVKKKTALS